jgi:hypothetical protein
MKNCIFPFQSHHRAEPSDTPFFSQNMPFLVKKGLKSCFSLIRTQAWLVFMKIMKNQSRLGSDEQNMLFTPKKVPIFHFSVIRTQA